MAHFVQAVTIRWFNACAYYATALARGLDACGHRVTLAGGEGTPVLEKAHEWGIEVLSGSSFRSKNPLAYVADISAFRKFALENDVSLVNVHNGKDHLAWSFALMGTGIPLVRTSGNRIPPKVHIGARMLMRHTAGVIASCNAIRTYYSDGFGIAKNRIRVINGGIDSVFFSPDHPRARLRKSLGIPGDAFVYGIIGRFSPVKGHRHFLQAAGILAEKYPDARFIVSGWDAQLKEKDIRLMAEESRVLGRTVFLGQQHDIRDLIGSLDVGVIASTGSETVCRIAMEYMAMGIPVIAACTNVLPEIIRHGKSGIIVSAGDYEAMESAMEQLITSKEGAKEMGKRGREIIEKNFTLESFAAQTLDAYGSIIGHG